MTGTVTVPAGVDLVHLPAVFPLLHGGSLGGAVLAAERQGQAGAPVVVVLGGISAGRHVAAHPGCPGPGWWEGVVGEGLAIDTRRLQVLGIDWLGGAGASTGPVPGRPFPLLATADQADALAALLDGLGIARVAAVVGASYGGMVGLQFAARHPQRLARLAVLGAAHRAHPQANAFRAVQRAIVDLGLRHGAGREALALARGLAMVTYRTPAELARRFGGPPLLAADRLRTPVQDWLEARGAEFAARFSPEQFRCLCASLDAHRLDPQAVTVPTWLASFQGDQLVPPADVAELAAALPARRGLVEIRTSAGHDGFLLEVRAVGAWLREVLS